jgi:hypothetical protein
MLNFHPSYAKAELIHQKVIQHLETLRVPEDLKRIAYISNYRVIDIITAATALYFTERTLTSRQIEKQISSLTQAHLENIRFNNSGGPPIIFFRLLCENDVPASFHPYNGIIKVRGSLSFIDLYDLTVKPERFLGLITENTLDFHARRLQTLLGKTNIEIIPDIETIKAELSRINGLDTSFDIQKLTAHLVLYKDVLPICVTYIPNGVINNISEEVKYIDSADILRRATSEIKKSHFACSNLKSIAIMSYGDSFYKNLNSPTRKTQMPSAYIRLQLHYENLNHLLQPTIEERELSGNYSSSIPIGDQTNDELEEKAIEEIVWSVIKNIDDDIRIVKSTYHRRILAKNKRNARLFIDKVAKEMLSKIDEINPQDGMDIRMARLKSSKIKVESGGSFFSGHRERKNGVRVSKQIWFRIKDGKFTCKVELNESVTWEKDCLKIRPMIPETITASLKGKLASEVIDHPIADMIGSVKSAKNKSDHTEIKFNLNMEEL